MDKKFARVIVVGLCCAAGCSLPLGNTLTAVLLGALTAYVTAFVFGLDWCREKAGELKQAANQGLNAIRTPAGRALDCGKLWIDEINSVPTWKGKLYCFIKPTFVPLLFVGMCLISVIAIAVAVPLTILILALLLIAGIIMEILKVFHFLAVLSLRLFWLVRSAPEFRAAVYYYTIASLIGLGTMASTVFLWVWLISHSYPLVELPTFFGIGMTMTIAIFAVIAAIIIIIMAIVASGFTAMVVLTEIRMIIDFFCNQEFTDGKLRQQANLNTLTFDFGRYSEYCPEVTFLPSLLFASKRRPLLTVLYIYGVYLLNVLSPLIWLGLLAWNMPKVMASTRTMVAAFFAGLLAACQLGGCCAFGWIDWHSANFWLAFLVTCCVGHEIGRLISRRQTDKAVPWPAYPYTSVS